MKAPGLPADQQFFADLFSGLVLNPQLLGARLVCQPACLVTGGQFYVLIFPVWISCCAANTATCWKQSSSEWWKEKMLFYSGTRG